VERLVGTLVGTNAKQSGSLSAKPIVASKSSVESRAMISRKNFPSKRCGQERTMGKKANKESNGNRTANYRVLVKQALSLDVSGRGVGETLQSRGRNAGLRSSLLTPSWPSRERLADRAWQSSSKQKKVLTLLAQLLAG
jgi:hypothetical protein